MKILFIGGDHLRHLYFLNALMSSYELCGALIQVRESMIPVPPMGLTPLDHNNFVRHFAGREAAEYKYFGDQHLPPTNLIFKVSPENLNSLESVKFVQDANPDVVLIFGSDLIKEPLLSMLPRHTLNLHLGLSPRYRGAATLFWPFYFMEPTYAGSTFHYIVSEPDAGDIIHQVIPTLQRGDGIHDVSSKVVIDSVKHAIRLLEIFERGGVWKLYKQKSTGKNFLGSDFRPQHLRVIYNVFNDDMVDCYLDGNLESRTPRLVRQF